METINPSTPAEASEANGARGFKPVLSVWALVLFGLAFVGPTAPYTFFGVGSVKSHGHFALVYLIAMLAVSFTAVSYGRMAAAFPGSGLDLRLRLARALIPPWVIWPAGS